MLDRIRELSLDRISIGHLNGGTENIVQAKLSILRQHDQNASGRAWRYRRQWSVLWRVFHPLRLIEFRVGSRWRDTKGVDADNLAGVRVKYQRLSLSAP